MYFECVYLVLGTVKIAYYLILFSAVLLVDIVEQKLKEIK